MTALVNSCEAEVAVLSHFAVLNATPQQRLIAGSGELGFVGVIQSERDGLASEPVADIVGVAW